MTSDTRPDVLALAVNLCPRCGKDGGNLTSHICHTSIGRAVQPNLIAVMPGECCPTCGQPVRVVSSDEGTSHYEAAAGYEAQVAGCIPPDAIDAIKTLPAIYREPLQGTWVSLEQVVALLEGWKNPPAAAGYGLIEPWREALEDCVMQFGYRVEGPAINSAGLSALERALDLLGWDDPHPLDQDLACDIEGCRRPRVSGVHWGDHLYLRLCDNHTSDCFAKKDRPPVKAHALAREATRDANGVLPACALLTEPDTALTE